MVQRILYVIIFDCANIDVYSAALITVAATSNDYLVSHFGQETLAQVHQQAIDILQYFSKSQPNAHKCILMLELLKGRDQRTSVSLNEQQVTLPDFEDLNDTLWSDENFFDYMPTFDLENMQHGQNASQEGVEYEEE
jgi:hypothetical protein